MWGFFFAYVFYFTFLSYTGWPKNVRSHLRDMNPYHYTRTLRCVIPVVCVTNEREESVINQHN